MAPPKKESKTVRSGNVGETATTPSNLPVPSAGVTREELNSVVAELQQQMATQSNLMLEKLTALLAAQNAPATQRVEVGAEGISHSSPPEENVNVGDHRTGVDNNLHRTNIEDHPTRVDNDFHDNTPNGDNLNTRNPCQPDNRSQRNRNPPNAGGTTGGAPPMWEVLGPSQLFMDVYINGHQRRWLASAPWGRLAKRSTFPE